MAKKKLQVSDVLKKDLKVVGYLCSFGVGSFLAQKYLVDSQELSLVLGAALNYVLYRLEKELRKEGYRAAMK